MAVSAPAFVSRQAPSLYADVIGPGWSELPAIVRRMHEEGCAVGRFTIHRGQGLLTLFIGWCCRFPAAGEDVPTRLEIRREGDGQRWERSFGAHLLVTFQRACKGGLLGERFGPMECVFRLRAVADGIVYEQVETRLCLGPWRLPVPGFLAPRVEAVTAATPQGMRARVTISAALVGWLLTYEGLVRPEEESP